MTTQETQPPRRLERPVFGTRAWIMLCAVAESLGMTAAASAALAADSLLDDLSVLHRGLAWLAVVVAGMTEAVALSLAQCVLLRTLVAGLRPTRFMVTTILVAGTFWAAASVPSLTGSSSDDTGGQPPWLLVLLAGAALGTVAGGLLGGAQALTFRSQVSRPWVWTAANVVGWTLAMPIIMLGATALSAGWPTVTVLSWAGLTGLVAGATLGAVLGWFTPSLQGASLHNRVVLALVGRGRPRRLTGAVMGLRLTGRRTGRQIRLPVMYAEGDDELWVAVGRSQRKAWWRNVTADTRVAVLRHGSWRPALADLVPPADDRYRAGMAVYTHRWPPARLGPTDPLVRVTEDGRS